MVGTQQLKTLSYQLEPSLATKKELIREKCLIVYSKIKSAKKLSHPLVVAAFSYSSARFFGILAGKSSNILVEYLVIIFNLVIVRSKAK
jgi:hypothetical protein